MLRRSILPLLLLLGLGFTHTAADRIEPECAVWRSLPKHVRDRTPPPPNCTVVDEIDPVPTSDPDA